MKRTFLTLNSVLSKSLVFLTIFMFTACKSGDPYRQKIIISGITEQYAGSDELQREFKKVTQEVLHLWDSIALVNETIVIDTLGLHAQQTNRYIAHFSVSPVYDDYLKQVNYKYLVEIESTNTGERFQEFTTSFSPESSMFPPNKEIIRIYFTPSNFNLMVPADKPIRQVKPVDSVKTFHIRSINFENDDFNESQQNFLINLINNAFIAGEKNNTLFNKALPSWGSPTDYYTIPYVPGNSMDDPDIDHVLDFSISMDQENKLIKINFEMGGREEPNLLIPARFPTEIEFDAHSFQMGELYEPSTKLSQQIYSLVRRQYFLNRRL